MEEVGRDINIETCHVNVMIDIKALSKLKKIVR